MTATRRGGAVGRFMLLALVFAGALLGTASPASAESMRLTAGSGFYFRVDGALRTCTLGPLVTWVEDGTTVYGGLTAGHCGKVGVSVSARRNGDAVGRISHTLAQGTSDIGVVQFDSIKNVRVSGIDHHGLADYEVGQDVVVHGSVTRVTTGTVTGKFDGASFSVTAPTRDGDSGGPVYGIKGVNTRTVIGIVHGFASDGSTVVVSAETMRTYIGPNVRVLSAS